MSDRATRRSGNLIQAAPLRRYAWLAHAFTTRSLFREGWFNLSYSVTRDAESVTRNRRALARKLGLGRARWVTLRQRHTDIVREIGPQRGGARKDPGGAWRLAGDAAVTDHPGIVLAVQVADCVPILLVEPRKRIIAAVHAGWRGTVRRIAEKTAGILQQRFGADLSRVRVALGPSIRSCCYRVGREVVEEFRSQFSYCEELVRTYDPAPSQVHWQQPVSALLQPRGPRRPRPAVTAPEVTEYYLDLELANRRQLVAAGVTPGNIWSSPECTACDTRRFFSHRADAGRTGRMMALIGIVDG